MKGDILLAVFMMHESLKGEESFYAPFLRILPEPSNISEWTDTELNLLQVCSLILCCKFYSQLSSLKIIFPFSGCYIVSASEKQAQPVDCAYDNTTI